MFFIFFINQTFSSRLRSTRIFVLCLLKAKIRTRKVKCFSVNFVRKPFYGIVVFFLIHTDLAID